MPSKFQPAWWLPNAHGQTIWPHLFRKPPRIKLSGERLELPDGDFVDLCWTQHNTGPIVIILHGLEGCVRSHYAIGILAAIDESGWRGVLMHFRGCSGDPNRLQRSYHSGDTGDIAYLIQTLRQRHPDSPLAAIGYSLGGNVLLKYLGESEDQTCLRAAVAVSVPFLLDKSAAKLATGVSRFYQWYLLRRLRHKLLAKFKGNNLPIPENKLHKLTTFRLFDGAVTAPVHGFKDADDYYTRSSSRQFLKHINIPTLVCHALDDPFIPPDAIPESNELSQHVKLELSAAGGHVGFVSGKFPWLAEHWLEQRIPEFLRTYIE